MDSRRLRHYRELLDVRGDPNTFVSDQAANALARLRELYAGSCHRGTFIEEIVSVDPDTAQQPCEYQYDSPEGLAQVCVGYTARVREYSLGDIVTGIEVGDSDSVYAFGEAAGGLRVAIQGNDAAVLRKGQRVPVRVLIAQYPHGGRAVAVVEVVTSASFVGRPYRISGKAAATTLELAELPELAGDAAKRAAQFKAAITKATGAGKGAKAAKPAFDLDAALAGELAVPAGVYRCVAGVIVAAPAGGDAPIELPIEAALADLRMQQAAFDAAAHGIGSDYASAADFAAHSNVWRLFERAV